MTPWFRNAVTLASTIAGVILYLLVGFPYLASGLVVPYPWVFLLWAAWVGGLVVLVRVVRRAPIWTPAVAVGAVAFWVLVVQLGDWLLGWTA